MRILVTGSSGHLGEALACTLTDQGHEVVGVDVLPRRSTTMVGSITDRPFVHRCMEGVEAVFHTATLHKPHVATHSRQAFVDVNVSGTLNLLEEAAAARVRSFVFTSSTSVFGHAMRPPPGAPAAWVTEATVPVPRNIYGVTKSAAEDLCAIFHRNRGLASVVLRTSRFFPEADDDADARRRYDDLNLKAMEFLYRRVDIEDVVSAHLLAAAKAPVVGFGTFIISATTPFHRDDVEALRTRAPEVVELRVPGTQKEFARRGWTMLPEIDRVYDNRRAREELDWKPRFDFREVLQRLQRDQDPRSDTARRIGSRGYHAETFTDGPFPVE